MNEMIKAERNKICSRKQTRMLFLAGVVLIVAYFFFFQFNYQNVFYDYDLEKMALASGFTAIEQRKEVAEIFEGKLSQNTLLTMQEKIDQAKQATVGQDENSAFSAVHVYRDQAAILEYLTNSDGSFKSLETAYPNSPTVTLGYCDGWDKLLSGMGSILSIMIMKIRKEAKTQELTKMENGEQLTFEFEQRPTIKGFPELRWTGKRPYRSTQYYPAQLRETYGKEQNGWINKIFWGDNLQVMSHLLKEYT